MTDRLRQLKDLHAKNWNDGPCCIWDEVQWAIEEIERLRARLEPFEEDEEAALDAEEGRRTAAEIAGLS